MKTIVLFLFLLLTFPGCASKLTARQLSYSDPPPVADNRHAIKPTSNRAQIQKVITRHSSRLKETYLSWLEKHPDLEGKIKVNFTIMPNGRVDSVAITQNTMTYPEFGESVVEQVQKWNFSSAIITSPLKIEVPFSFGGRD